MKGNIIIIAAMAMLLSACVFRFNGRTGHGLASAESAQAAVRMADSAAAKGFKAIESYGFFDVYYTQDSVYSVKLVGDTASVRRTIVQSDGKTLTIRTADDRKFFRNKSYSVDVYITAPVLVNVGVLGSGSFIANDAVSQKNLTISVAGSGSVQMNGVRSDELAVDIAGSGDVTLAGVNTTKAKFSVAGSGDYTIKGLKAGNVSAQIAGSGDINITEADVTNAKCSIAGSGDIDISGRIDNVERSIAGSGSISVRK